MDLYGNCIFVILQQFSVNPSLSFPLGNTSLSPVLHFPALNFHATLIREWSLECITVAAEC